MKSLIIYLSLGFILIASQFACSADSNNQRIVGQWQGNSWTVKGEPSGRNASEVIFKFNADDTYTAAFGAQQEGGSFRLVENKLYTTAKDQAEKMVQITLRTPDTLVMDMNRVGTLEELVLVKQ